MALQHFSHRHPLMLIHMEGRKEKIECECCGKPILSSAYGCTQCNYFLHTNCGTLPRVIKHHLHPHPQHLLTLYNKGTAPDYASRSSYCLLCFRTQTRFIYLCSLCGFNVHALCATLEKTTIEDNIHEHPLTFVRRMSLFACDACGTEDEDLSYRCTSAECQFWIHTSCASSVSTLHRNDHIHPLLLAYYVPYQLQNFSHHCYICEKRVYHSNWVYYCASCRYFAHLKCAKSKEEPLMLSEENLDPSMVHFPMPDEESLFQLMIQILTKMNSSSKGSVMVDTRIHNCHYYPLIDFEVERSKEMKNKEMLCDVCVRPISFPFDTCVKCSFILHKSCSRQLALKKEKPDHPEHPVDLSCPAVNFNYSYCSSCSKYTNSFCNECTTCTSFLGVCCASTCLPITIKHEAHKHPLRLLQTERFTLPTCTACDQAFYGALEYRCGTCKFHLEIDCAKLPGTVKHEWDRHPLSLTYPPFDHPDDYFCEICEEDIHPNHWLYHCRICDQSFHTKCVCPPNNWSSVKFGGIYKFEHHPHNLRLVSKKYERAIFPL